MAGIAKHWRESASLILASKRLAMKQPQLTFLSKLLRKDPKLPENTNQELYRLLLLKRSSGNLNLPDAYMFPGGIVDNTDFSKDWLEVFGNTQNIWNMFKHRSPATSIFSCNRGSQYADIPSDIGLRITAIRETFEESGVLLARPNSDLADKRFLSSNHPSFGTVCNMPNDMAYEWRTKIILDPSQFIVMCKECGMIPDVCSLYEWSNWLSPRLKSQRYDTAFFISCIDEAPLITDSQEIELGVWADPSGVLKACSEGNLTLAPPQSYELSRLVRFENTEDLLKFAWKRSDHGVQKWMPVIFSCSDGILFALPGDDMYPENPDYLGKTIHGPRMLTETFEELQAIYPQHHRIFVDNSKNISLHVNIPAVDGHILPLAFNTSFQLRSKAKSD